MALNLAAGVVPVAGYTLVRQLGRGGFGEVWEALAPGDVRVALKFVRLDTAEAGPEQRALAIIRDIRHPHLLDIQFAAQVEDCLVLGMPLCERTLSDRFRQCREQGLPGVPRDELLGYMDDLARAVDFLNEPRNEPDGGVRAGIQHRDIKPNNIFLVGGAVRLADFGLAKVLASSAASHTGAMSPNYVAPEVIEGRVSSRSDQYSLAVTYVQLRAGRLPFTGEGIPHLLYAHLQEEPDLSGLPKEERATVARALAKRPDDRWPSCRAFVEDLKTAGSASAYRADVEPTLTAFNRSGTDHGALATETLGPCPFPSTDVDDAPATTDPAVLDPVVTDPATTEPFAAAVRPPSHRLRLVVLAGLLAAVAGPAAFLIARGGGLSSSVAKPTPPEPPAPEVVKPAPPKEPSPSVAAIVPTTVSTTATPGPPPMSPPMPVPKASRPEPKVEPEAPTQAPERPGPVESVAKSIGMTLVLVPAGEFVAGPRAGGQATPRVQVARPFYLGAREVTQAEYQQVMTDNPSKFSPHGEFRAAVAGQDTGGNPVENVSWNDAITFCNRLSEKEGLEACYGPNGEHRPGRPGYRLPTEAEWEYACRAGSEAPYAFGDDEAGLGDYAWFAGNSDQQTHAAGRKRPNRFGLYDMHGNVWEWCRDEYRPVGPRGSSEADTNAASPSPDRIFRGGGYADDPRLVRAESRAWGSRALRDAGLGFRVARDLGKPGD